MDINEIPYQEEESTISQKPLEKEKLEEEVRSPRLLGIILFIIVFLIILILFYFFNPVCDFQRIGGKYSAGDECNICLCSIKGFICTNLECEDIGNNILSEFEELCSWEPGDCDTECVYEDDRYFYIKEIGSCQQWKIGNCCSEPPFDTKEECQLICEN